MAIQTIMNVPRIDEGVITVKMVCFAKDGKKQKMVKKTYNPN